MTRTRSVGQVVGGLSELVVGERDVFGHIYLAIFQLPFVCLTRL